MHVRDIELLTTPKLSRVVASVRFEDSERPDFAYFAETTPDFTPALRPDPNALLIACILPAWGAGERRIRIDSPLCPLLTRDMLAALRVLAYWFPDLGPWPAIECPGFEARQPAAGPAVSLLSCGIDSLATLRQNTMLLPLGHPLRIGAALPVIFVQTPGEGVEALDAGRLPAARRIAADLDVGMAPVWTNLWWLVDDGYFFDLKWHGALFASLAALFGGGYSGAYIGSSDEGGNLFNPWGSNPLLDPYYSSAHFRIQHHGCGLTRLDKTAMVADWPAGAGNLRVCQNDPTGAWNCGTCEKCINVMTTLVALGRLGDCSAFAPDDVNAELLQTVKQWDMIDARWKLDLYLQLLPLLSRRGRHDLVAAIRSFADHFQRKGLPP